MGCAHKENQDGFTLVEIAIVMIIIGLLIGGTFGGMKLIENMQVNRTVQDLKAIESAALTFKDTYGRLPGDMPNTAARLPSCTIAPCATGGNGDRKIGVTFQTGPTTVTAITSASEEFLFWHHLQASDLLSLGIRNSNDLSFGEGQPESPMDGGYRMAGQLLNSWSYGFSRPQHAIAITKSASGSYVAELSDWRSNQCIRSALLDAKMDDGFPYGGKISSYLCAVPYDPSSPYLLTNLAGDLFYETRF
jgi:prepilin-type N-terminal cleavage/methylation domain-containing protein